MKYMTKEAISVKAVKGAMVNRLKMLEKLKSSPDGMSKRLGDAIRAKTISQFHNIDYLNTAKATRVNSKNNKIHSDYIKVKNSLERGLQGNMSVGQVKAYIGKNESDYAHLDNLRLALEASNRDRKKSGKYYNELSRAVSSARKRI